MWYTIAILALYAICAPVDSRDIQAWTVTIHLVGPDGRRLDDVAKKMEAEIKVAVQLMDNEGGRVGYYPVMENREAVGAAQVEVDDRDFPNGGSGAIFCRVEATKEFPYFGQVRVALPAAAEAGTPLSVTVPLEELRVDEFLFVVRSPMKAIDLSTAKFTLNSRAFGESKWRPISVERVDKNGVVKLNLQSDHDYRLSGDYELSDGGSVGGAGSQSIPLPTFVIDRDVWGRPMRRFEEKIVPPAIRVRLLVEGQDGIDQVLDLADGNIVAIAIPDNSERQAIDSESDDSPILPDDPQPILSVGVRVEKEVWFFGDVVFPVQLYLNPGSSIEKSYELVETGRLDQNEDVKEEPAQYDLRVRRKRSR